MFAELDRIAAAIPHDELAVQWDVAVEFGILEDLRFAASPELKQSIIERLILLGHQVPADVELGYHLCYGDSAALGGAHPKPFPTSSAFIAK